MKLFWPPGERQKRLLWYLLGTPYRDFGDESTHPTFSLFPGEQKPTLDPAGKPVAIISSRAVPGFDKFPTEKG